MSYDRISAVHNLLITRCDVLGALACWAVRQSPYTVPEQLAEAIEKFHVDWPVGTTVDSFKFSCNLFPTLQALEAQIDATIALNPIIQGWNNRKNRREGMGFSSRYDQPNPDDDFIDLGALSRNIAIDVWRDAVRFDEFNKDFDARHPTDPATGRLIPQPPTAKEVPDVPT